MFPVATVPGWPPGARGWENYGKAVAAWEAATAQYVTNLTDRPKNAIQHPRAG